MKTRWVYSELGSPRWNEAYTQLKGHTPLAEKAAQHVPFSSLSDEEREQLLEYAPKSSRRGLMGRLGAHASYRLERWTKTQIRALNTTPQHGSIPFDEFLAGAPKPGEEATDARVTANALGYHPDKWEAVTVVGKRGDYTLLDGYTRAVAYMRAAPSSAKLAVRVPDE
jgi:hypothetical protein